MWYLVYTKPNQEFRAKDNLENQSFITLLPRIEIRNKASIEAMFPRYLFVKFNITEDNWQKIKSTKGVSHLVSFNLSPALVPENLILDIKSILDDQDILRIDHKKKRLTKGDRIIVLNGPLKGIEGTFLSSSGNKRASILLRILKQSVNTEISSSDIGKLEL